MAVKNKRPRGRSLGNPLSKRGSKATLDIVRLGINGEGVGYLRGQVVFVDGALPGERVKVQAISVKERYAKAQITEIIKSSNDRMKGKCSVYRACGGCSLQHYYYPAQLKAKKEIVAEAFEKYLGKEYEIPEIRPVLGMENPWYYRNKAQIPLSQEGNKVIAGLYKAGSNKIIEMKTCKVHHNELDNIIDGVRGIAEKLQIPVYNPKTKKGQLKNIAVRISFSSGEMQVIFITAQEQLTKEKELIKEIALRYPKVVSIAQNISPSDTPLVMGDKTAILWGQERLIEKVGGLKYALSPRAFFQLNPIQTEVLYNEAAKASGLTGKEKVLDAYCGAGTISLWLAGQAEEMRGIEIVPDAIKDAKYNAELNNIDNVSFHVGKVEKLLPKWVKEGYKPDVIVVDPPRTGCDEKLLKAICQAKPKRLVYVSCNPATLAKDCRVLLGKGFRIEYVQPVDMFPQTSHVECVVRIQRKKGL